MKTGAGAEYVQLSRAVLVFCAADYFESRACARELILATLLRKPLITVIEPDATRGGLTQAMIKKLLVDQKYSPHSRPEDPADQSWVAKWGLEKEMQQYGFGHMPTVEEIVADLLADETIEWNRLPHFQGVSVRLMAERVLPLENRGAVFVQDEAGSGAVKLSAPTHGRRYHLYCSPHNQGASKLTTELSQLLDQKGHEGCLSRCGRRSTSIRTTETFEELDECEFMLVYLTSATWTQGQASMALAREVSAAHRLGVPMLTVHEFPTMMEDDAVRGACSFNDFWKDGWTPRHLLVGDANIYKQIALALKTGAWRAAGLATVIGKIRESGGGDRHPIHVDEPGARPQPRGAKRWGTARFKLGTATKRKGSMRGGLTAPEHSSPSEQSGPNAGVGPSQMALDTHTHVLDGLQTNHISMGAAPVSVVTAPSVESRHLSAPGHCPPSEQSAPNAGVGPSQMASDTYALDGLQTNHMPPVGVVTAPSVESHPNEQREDDFRKLLNDRLSILSHRVSTALEGSLNA